MRRTLLVASVLVFAGASEAPADTSYLLTVQKNAATTDARLSGASPRDRNGHPTKQPPADERRCTTDGLIHAQVSPAITQHVTASIKLLELGARVREVAKLILPCGFHLDGRYGSNLVLTNGGEVRRYLENNPFGFAPAFGFSEQTTQSYTLNFRTVSDSELHADSCADRLKGIKGAPQQCASFGSETSMFGTLPDAGMTRIAHFKVHGSAVEEDFPVANVTGRVKSIFFLPPPDAPGGTITLILADRQGMYRAFLDTPRG